MVKIKDDLDNLKEQAKIKHYEIAAIAEEVRALQNQINEKATEIHSLKTKVSSLSDSQTKSSQD